MSGKTREQVIEEMAQIAGVKIKLDTYKKWETRTPLPHHLIIAFCEVTGADPYLLLTGTPFRLGRPIPTRHQATPQTAA